MTELKDAVKAVTSLANIDRMFGGSRQNLGTSADAYGRVPLIRRAVDLRADALATVPYRLYEGDSEIEWPFQTPIEVFVDHASRFWDVYGFFVAEKVKNPRGSRIVDLRLMNSGTVTMMLAGVNNGKPIIQYNQTINGIMYGPFYDEDVVIVKDFNPTDDIIPGRGAVQVALEAARLMHYQTQMAASYFEAGAMPAVRIKVPPTMGENDRRKLQTTMDRLYSGLRRGLNRFLVLSNNIEVDTIAPTPNQLAFPELSQFARREIALALGIPQTMLEDTSNRSSREQDTKTFWETTIKPRAMMIVEAINSQLFGGTAYRLEALFDEMTIFQEDEWKRSESLLHLVTAGVPLNVALATLGYDLPTPESVPMIESTRQPDTFNELTLPQSISGQPIAPEAKAMMDELAVWKRWSMRRIKSGRAIRDFETEYLPVTLAEAIKSSLRDARNPHEVELIFGDAEAWVMAGDGR